ncbi:hypothetical protein [Euzebya sp.]|uniref:hypothetical protein n=1 Tax=Euzebya sp. TaxID=1971409 RepID=UPI0035191055
MDLTRAIRGLHLHLAHTAADDADTAALIRRSLDGLDVVEQRAVIRHAYWRMPEVPTTALRMAVGSDDALRALAGRGPVVGSCRRCGRVLRARTRDAVDLDPPRRCAECRTPGPSGRLDRRPGFGWEFQPVATWRPADVPPAALAARRRWAEQYPDVDAV